MKKRYPIHQCVLYQCNSKKKLAFLLQTEIKTIKNIIRNLDNNYKLKIELKKNGKPRKTYNPSTKLKKIQKRLHYLLKYIRLPNYIFSKVGYSHVDAAKHHCGSDIAYTLDIKKFFPSIKFNSIYSFFLYQLKCSEDISYLLANLTVYNNSLVEGSPASQTLAILSSRDMFEKINKIAMDNNLKLSVYVDDITISGENISKHIKLRIKSVINNYGFKYHKEKLGSLINGVRVHNIIVKKN